MKTPKLNSTLVIDQTPQLVKTSIAVILLALRLPKQLQIGDGNWAITRWWEHSSIPRVYYFHYTLDDLARLSFTNRLRRMDHFISYAHPGLKLLRKPPDQSRDAVSQPTGCSALRTQLSEDQLFPGPRPFNCTAAAQLNRRCIRSQNLGLATRSSSGKGTVCTRSSTSIRWGVRVSPPRSLFSTRAINVIWFLIACSFSGSKCSITGMTLPGLIWPRLLLIRLSAKGSALLLNA
jgi:hypothetical protein